VIDIAKIVVMVGGRLLRQGMAPLGLWRSLKAAPVLPGRSALGERLAEDRASRDAQRATSR
jgi:hypothetical protein